MRRLSVHGDAITRPVRDSFLLPVTERRPAGSSASPNESRPKPARRARPAAPGGGTCPRARSRGARPAAPRARAVRDERRDVADEPVRGRRGELGDDGPVRLDPGERRLARPDPPEIQVQDIDREHPARPQRVGHGRQRRLDGGRAGQVAERVPDRDDRVRGGSGSPAAPAAAGRRPGPAPRGPARACRARRRWRSPVPCGQQVPGQRPAAAAEFQDQATADAGAAAPGCRGRSGRRAGRSPGRG